MCSDIWCKKNVIWEQLSGWRELSSQKLENKSLSLNMMVQDNDVFSRQKKEKWEWWAVSFCLCESSMTEEPRGHFFLHLMMWPLLDHTQFSALRFRAASAVGVG